MARGSGPRLGAAPASALALVLLGLAPAQAVVGGHPAPEAVASAVMVLS